MSDKVNSRPVRITGARHSLTEDVRHRQRRYLISMGIRTVAFLACVPLWNVYRPAAWVAIALGLLLPYVSVVFANGGRESTPNLPSSFDFMPNPTEPPALPPPGEGSADEPRQPEDSEEAQEKLKSM